MTAQNTVDWLAGLQSRFSSVLRTPLKATTGVLIADKASYSEAALADILPSARLSSAERLGIYHRQYWMRLFRVLQEQYPLVTRLCGAWGFNQHAMRFLDADPPRERDLGKVAEGFDGFLAASLHDDPVKHWPTGPSLPRAALIEAARLDKTFRCVFLAPQQPVFQPTFEDQAALLERRLHLSPTLVCFGQHWPLLQLRRDILGSKEEYAVPLPAPLSELQVWALHQTPRGIAHVLLSQENARLLELLKDHTVADALSILEVECSSGARSGLPERVERFFRSAVQAGFFSGLR